MKDDSSAKLFVCAYVLSIWEVDTHTPKFHLLVHFSDASNSKERASLMSGVRSYQLQLGLPSGWQEPTFLSHSILPFRGIV